jgi:NADH:ubiquinone oxidoreductase subunit E
MIVQALRAIQDRCGYLPEGELRALAERINVPLYRLHAVASFFPHYRLKPPPAVDVKVCRDMSCHLAGARRLRQGLTSLAQEIGGGQVLVDGVSCLGQCDRAPAVSINDHVYCGLSLQELRARIRTAVAKEPLPHQTADRSPAGWRIDPYGGQPLYEAVQKLVNDRDIDGVLKRLESATLRGLGGAGFPTHRKWSAVRAAPAPKYIVCNADESEPGTFKDREILRRTPYLVVEGMMLAGLVTGADRGYIYVRHEFEEEIEAV